MTEYGLAGPRITDGNCVADLLVHAPAERIAGALGAPTLVQRGADLLVEEQPAGVVAYAAQPFGEGWSAVEATQALGFSLPGDHLELMFVQGEQALAGTTPTLGSELVYQNTLGIGARCSRVLGVEAIALWGSDEWPGIAGGALIDAAGAIVEAFSAYSVEEIGQSRAARDNFMARLRDDSIPRIDGPAAGDEGRWEVTWRWTPGEGLRQIEGGLHDHLDRVLRDARAREQDEPLDMHGEWYDVDEVWAVIA